MELITPGKCMSMAILLTHQLFLLLLIFPIICASRVLNLLNDLNTCVGKPEPKFILLRNTKKNGQFISGEKEIVAFLDTSACVYVNAEAYSVTVCCVKCHLLTTGERCLVCTKYRKNLIAQYSRTTQATQTKSSKINYRLLHLLVCCRYL